MALAALREMGLDDGGLVGFARIEGVNAQHVVHRAMLGRDISGHSDLLLDLEAVVLPQRSNVNERVDT